ncbi:putative methyltransferase [Nymphaea thermarum]|nr:putative methyltransferase [Nymphaea thermarum]
MKDRDGGRVPDRPWRSICIPVLVVVFCLLSFYMGVIYSTERDNVLKLFDSPNLSVGVGCTQSSGPQGASLSENFTFSSCDPSFQDYTPCTDPKRWRRYDRKRLSFRERHCPSVSERKECLVPPPEGYKIPLQWPESRDQCWYRNVPYEWINKVKAGQHWLKKEGDKFIFPGGGTMFPNGVGEYLDAMEELIPGMKDGSVRTAIDTGCGVASWGGSLLDRGILTMSLAPRDNHEAQVQFALERGIPAILGILSTQRLPYPSGAFDMAHCSRCLIPWAEFSGVLLMEVDRILRPGGFWVLSGPPVNYQTHWRGWNTTIEAEKANLDAIQKLLSGMCYKLYKMEGDLAVWQKPIDNTCYDARDSSVYPPKCDDSIEPDSAWYVPMRPCVVTESTVKEIAVDNIPRWPKRLTTIPYRFRSLARKDGVSFSQDTRTWQKRLLHYKSLLPALGTRRLRNVMDMNTAYGGLAAAMIGDPVWVMNVVSSYAPNTLPIVFDRGLIGTNSDWCEAFSTYPRTYDLLHLDGLFTAESHRCEMKLVLLEMDRILRPLGYGVLRDTQFFLEKALKIAEGMRWKCKMHATEKGKASPDRILICQKSFWTLQQTGETN